MDRNTWLKKRKITIFDPDHDTVSRAVDNFLAGGGEITKIEEVKESIYIYGHTSSSFFDDDDL